MSEADYSNNSNLTTVSPSNRTDQDAKIDSLVHEHYADVYRLASSVLRESDKAHRVSIRTFVTALLGLPNFHISEKARSKSELRIWLYRIALRVIQDVKHQPFSKVSIPVDITVPERRLWQNVDHLDSKEFILCFLHYVLSFTDSEAAAILHVSQSAIHTQLEIFRENFFAILRDERISQSIVTQTPDSSKRSHKDYQVLDGLVAESLQKRWPPVHFSVKDLENVTNQVKQIAAKERLKRQKTAPYKWIVLASGVMVMILMCLVLAALAWLADSGQILGSGQPTQWGLKRNSIPLGKAKPLTKRSSTEEILLRFDEGPQFWESLWIDTQTVIFGPQSYVGLPKAYRAQAWVRQPNQSVEISGTLSEPPNSIYKVSEGSSYYLNKPLGLSFADSWGGNTGELLSNSVLRVMVFPGSEIIASTGIDNDIGNIKGVEPTWKNGKGSFRTIEYDRVAGRRALVVDWINEEGFRVERLWLDTQTGLILRRQTYSKEDIETLVSESVATEIIYNQSEPPPQLGETLVLKESDTSLEWQNPTNKQDLLELTPTLAIPWTVRLSLYPEKAPENYDPTRSRLVFQFPDESKTKDSINNLAESPAEIFTDGYYLGTVEFGFPWVLRCDRSPDGKRVAFNTGSDGTVVANDSLRWFNLIEPEKIYLPLPQLHITNFAFSPDGRRLAAFGFGETEEERGIYLLEIGTGEYHLLTNLMHARSIVWSPDGEYLALIGSTFEDNKSEGLIIHVDTGQIAHRVETEYMEEDPSEWPVLDWGVEFPVVMSGMEECSTPP